MVTHVNPYSPGGALALGQDRDRRVVTVKPLGLEHMRLDQVEDRLEGEGDVPDLIGQGLGRQTDASHLNRVLWRFSGMCCPNLSNTIVASN